MATHFTRRIDSKGFFIEDFFWEDGEVLEVEGMDGDSDHVSYREPDPLPPDLILTPVPQGFDRPRWNGVSWGEGTPAAALALKRASISRRMKSEAITKELDAKAREKGYDSILSAISYLNDPNPVFRQEAQEFLELRSQRWAEASNK